MFLPDLHPVLLTILAAIALATIVAGHRQRRRRRPDLATYLAQQPHVAEPQAPRSFRGQPEDLPPEFARRIAARRRANHVAQGGMMVVLGLTVPLAHFLLAQVLGHDPMAPPLVWVSAMVMAALIIIGVLGIVRREP